MTTNPGTQLSSQSIRACASRALPTPASSPSTEAGDWRAGLATKLRPTQHGRTDAFDKLLGDYVVNGRVPDLSILVCVGMAHAQVNVLCEILAHEDMKSLWIRGLVNERGWATLVDAMQARPEQPRAASVPCCSRSWTLASSGV